MFRYSFCINTNNIWGKINQTYDLGCMNKYSYPISRVEIWPKGNASQQKWPGIQLGGEYPNSKISKFRKTKKKKTIQASNLNKKVILFTVQMSSTESRLWCSESAERPMLGWGNIWDFIYVQTEALTLPKSMSKRTEKKKKEKKRRLHAKMILFPWISYPTPRVW